MQPDAMALNVRTSTAQPRGRTNAAYIGQITTVHPGMGRDKVTVTPKYLTASPDLAERSCTFVSTAIPDGRSALMKTDALDDSMAVLFPKEALGGSR